MTLLDYAKFYVAKGFSVIPIKHKDKTPLLQSWKEYQKRKPTNEEITEWFKNGSKNIALVTGAISGVAVVDLDSEKAVEWATKNGLMTTPTQKTGKGYHLFFKYTNGTKNTQRRPDIPDIDIRGEGGYVVVSPSIHKTGNQYQWVEGKTLDDLELADFPTILLQPKEQNTFKVKEVLKGVNKGMRNDTLARLTGSNLFRGLTLEECLDFAYAWNERNNPPLPIDEVERTVKSIFERHEQQKNSNSGYFINDSGYLCKYKHTKDGLIPYPLCNFDARIQSDVTIDDGANQERYFEIIGKRGNKILPSVRIKTSQFTSLSWVTDHWGNDAIIETVQTAKDNIRYYIQTSSVDVDKRIIYSHTGWRVINGSWCYLTGGGAIGCEGVDVDLSLVGIKEGYEIPLQPENETEAIKTSLALLDIADRRVSIPLLSLTYLSCITTLLSPTPTFAGAFLYGVTGSCKTTISSLFASHFGDISTNNLINFETTPNNIIKKLSTLKDTFCIVDDFRPTHNKTDAEKQEAIAQRIIRLTANRTYRGRLNPDASIKKEPPINCMVLITGEDLPMLTSTLARVMLLELSRDMVNFEALTKSQRQRHLLPSAMASFIHWVIKNMNSIKTSFEQSFNDLRQQAMSPTIHGKLSEQFVYCVFTMTLLCRWLQDKGIHSEQQSKELLLEGQEILMGQMRKQSEMMQTEDPVEKFKDMFQTWLTLGKMRLSCRLGVNQDLGGVAGEFLGWYDDYHLYLLSGATWDFLMRYCLQHGKHFAFSKQTFYRMLAKKGLIEVDSNQTSKLVKIKDKNHRVLKMSRDFINDKNL